MENEENAPIEEQTNEGENEEQEGEGVVDSHGQPGINKERHDREVAALNDKIAELQRQLNDRDAAAKNHAELQKQLDDMSKAMEDEKVNHALELAGCVDLKAARSRLEDFGGDVAKLKDGAPYLFGQSKKAGATGAKPVGPVDDSKERINRARKAAGLKPQE